MLVGMAWVTRRLGLDRETVREAVVTGRIPGTKVDGAWRFNPDEIEAWVAEQAERKRALRIRRGDDGWDEVRQFIWAKIPEGEPIEVFCRRVELSYIPTWELLTHRRTPSPQTAETFRAVLGEQLPRMPTENPAYVTVAEAATILKVEKRTLWRFKRDGMLTTVGKGKHLRYVRSELEAMAARRAAITAETEQLGEDSGSVDSIALSHPDTQPPTCPCKPDCTSPVLTPGRTYARGHFPRTPGSPRGPNRGVVVSRCALCPRQFEHPAGRSRVYCSNICKAAARRNARTPRNGFERFLYDRWRATGLSLRACSLEWGLGPKGLGSYIDGARPADAKLEILRRRFGDELPNPEPAEEGFTSDTERRRAQIRALREKGTAASLKARARTNQREAQRRKPRSQKAIDTRRETIKTSAAYAEGQEKTRAYAQSGRGRAIASLTHLLERWHRWTGGDSPDTTLELWAAKVVEQLRPDYPRVTAELILEGIWKPFLRRRDPKRRRGRRAKDEEARCRVLHKQMADENWDGCKETRPYGFDSRYGDLINEDHNTAQKRRKYHLPRCPIYVNDVLTERSPKIAISG